MQARLGRATLKNRSGVAGDRSRWQHLFGDEQETNLLSMIDVAISELLS
jgi:hypothetical protein